MKTFSVCVTSWSHTTHHYTTQHRAAPTNEIFQWYASWANYTLKTSVRWPESSDKYFFFIVVSLQWAWLIYVLFVLFFKENGDLLITSFLYLFGSNVWSCLAATSYYQNAITFTEPTCGLNVLFLDYNWSLVHFHPFCTPSVLTAALNT